MPPKMRQAIVTPLLKKTTLGLNSNKLKNYRPVLNLSFVSKLTEKVEAARLIAHLLRNNLQELLQLAYRQYCSIETALLKVQSDILRLTLSTMASCFTHTNTRSALQESAWGGWNAISETGVKLFAYQESSRKTLHWHAGSLKALYWNLSCFQSTLLQWLVSSEVTVCRTIYMLMIYNSTYSCVVTTTLHRQWTLGEWNGVWLTLRSGCGITCWC